MYSDNISLPPQAEEFQSVVQVMREFLPQAESELKFKALPDDEVAIIQLIEKHEVSYPPLTAHLIFEKK